MVDVNVEGIAAVILAAGLSRRMGVPKMVLPWGKTTVIGQVVHVLSDAGIGEIVVVTGGACQQVEAALQDLPVRVVFNPRFAEDPMAYSLQVGLASLPAAVDACLVVLGDQPQIGAQVVRGLVQAYRERGAPLVVPSFEMRRGHPWLLDRSLWPEVTALRPPGVLRDVLNSHASQIEYLIVTDNTILCDLDTPEDYARQRPQAE
jgi:molybdenum cofactor cytidylyltransferase